MKYPCPAVRFQLTARCLVAMVLLALATHPSPTTGQDAPGLFVPVDAKPGKIYRIRQTTGNRGVQFQLINASLESSYGPLKAGQGKQLVVIATEWENVIPLTIIKDKDQSTAYKIPQLADHLYLIADGKRVSRLMPRDDNVPGHIPVKDFGLAKIGDRLRGNLVFEVDEAPKTLELRFYDLAQGHFTVSLADPAVVASLTPKPVGNPQANRVVNVGAYGLKRDTELNGRKAPEGMAYYSVDLRAESMWLMAADATAFDPNASPGTKVQKPIFADWTEWRKYVYLLIDNEYAYAVDPELSELPEVPRLLPEVMTGGAVVFLGPADTRAIELKLDFPAARAGTQIIRPNPLTLFLQGVRPQQPKRETLLEINDDILKVTVFGQKLVDEFAGMKPKDGKFIVLDIEVRNAGRQGEFIQTKEQLKLVTEQGQQMPVADATFAGLRRPTPLVYIPASEKRAFQVVYDVAPSLAKPRLAYAGVSMAKVFDLPGIAPASIAATQPAGPPATGPAVAGVKPPAKPIGPATVPATNKPAALPVRVAAKQAAKPLGLAAAGLTPEQVNAAIDRGAAYMWADLKKEMEGKSGNSLTGEHGLYLLALVHADHHKKNPECEAAVRHYLDSADPIHMGIYAAGIYLMLAEGFGDAMYMAKVRLAAKYLIESQGTGGTWGYGGNRDHKLYAEPAPDLSQPLSIVGGKPTEGPGSDEVPMTRVSKPEAGQDGDNSVTQYAILGLHSASRMGLKIPQEVWQRAHDAVRAWQQKDGGWGYHGGSAYGSMVCAGIGSLTLCRHHLGEKEPAADEVIERGIGWLDAKFSVSQNPAYGDTWLYYYLYGMERVGRILDTEFIGDHEWYPFGARMLLSKQEPSGRWIHTGQEAEPKMATSFALLFLTRATPNLAIARRTGPGTLKTEIVAPPMNRLYIILDASGSMLEEINGRQKFALAQDAVIALIQSLPENSEVALRAYGYRKRAIEKDADLDTALIVPMAKLDKKKLVDIVRGLRCRGKTPLATSLTQAAQDLAGATDKTRPVTLVLLTDGGEDTMPRQNPVKAAEAVAKLAGVSFQVVGFDINRQDWSEQLLATSRAGNGQYLPAAKADVLLDRLHAAIYRSPGHWVATDKDGKEVARGTFGQSAKLPAGKYTVTTSLAGLTFAREAWVNADSTTVARFDSVRVDFSKAPATPSVPSAQTPPTQAPPAQPPPAQPPVQPPAAQAPPAAPANHPKFCTSCGKPLTPASKFCTNCGKKVGG